MPSPRRAPAFVLALTLGLSFSLAASSLAAASPAADLFGAVTQAVQTGYYGWSTVDRAALAQKYAPVLEAKCAPQGDACSFDTGREVAAAMLKDLGDPHTNIRDPEAALRLAEVSENRSVARTGARVVRVAGGLLVASVMPGSPAEAAGVRPFDLLTQVQGQSAGLDQPIGPTEFIRLERAAQPFEVTLRRAGTPDRTLTLSTRSLQARDEPTLSWVGRNGKTALISYPTFLSSDSAELFLDRVGQARREGAEALVVDLRYNGGGSLGECVAAGSVFGPTVYRARFQRGGSTYGGLLGEAALAPVARMARPDWRVWTGPAAILVGPATASCAEVFSFFAQKSGVPLVGEATRGVGNSGVTFRPLPDGGVLGLTVLKAFDGSDQPLPERVRPDLPAPTDITLLTTTGRDTTLDAALTTLGVQGP